MNKMNSSISILLLCLYLLSCSSQPERNEEETYKSNLDSLKIKISKFAESYGAIRDWEDKIYFTIDAQEKLGDPNKLFLVNGIVYDVERKGRDVYLHILNEFSLFVKIVFVLKLEKQNNLKFGFFQDISLIAKIENVKKALFKITAEPIDVDEADISIDSFEKVVIAEGICIDYLLVDKK